MPIPQRSNEGTSILKRKSLTRGKTIVLTEFPYKNELEKKTRMIKSVITKKKKLKGNY
jgi:hypothetical protein